MSLPRPALAVVAVLVSLLPAGCGDPDPDPATATSIEETIATAESELDELDQEFRQDESDTR